MAITVTVTDTQGTAVIVREEGAVQLNPFLIPNTITATNIECPNFFSSDGSVEVAVSNSGTTFTGLTTHAGGITITGGSLTGSQTISNYVTDTAITTTEFQTYAGQKIIYTGGAGEIDLPAAVAADIGKSWIIINAGTGALTIDVNGSGTAQFVRTLTGGSVATSNSADKVIAAGGSAELICIADASITNSSSVPNWLLYGGGIS